MICNILQYLDRGAALWPDRVLLSGEDGELTYGELWELTRRVGSFLCRREIFREPVAVLLPRGVRAIAVGLGCVAGGCWFSFLDPQMPRERLGRILHRLEPRGIVCSPALAAELAYDGPCWDPEELLRAPVDDAALARVRSRALDTDPVYAVFTSGSTGEPKGVVGCHRAAIDYIENLSPVLRVAEDTVFGSHAPLYVDAWLKELFPAMKCGGKMVLIPEKLFLFPTKVVEFLNEHRVNALCWVVSALTGLSSLGTFQYTKPVHLRTVAFASEVFPPEQLRLWREALPGVRFLNLYGPTETTGVCCWYEVSGSETGPLPIGEPFPNTEVFLLDGEICIRGSRLTLGYLGEDQGGFCPDPRQGRFPDRIYRTGDLGRYDEEGRLLFLGRADSQIRHMGYRIELGEIEAAAWECPGVTGAGCVYLSERKRLVLFYSGTAEAGSLQRFLRERLPRYMLPKRTRHLEALPRTPNGKLHRAALLDIERMSQHGRTDKAPE